MKNYVGLDVSMKKTSVCIVDEEGKIVHESEVRTDPRILADAIEKINLQIELVGMESGSLSHYLQKGLKEKGLNTICIDAKKMNTLLSINVNKTDRNDARGIANALRTRMYSEVYPKPQEAIDLGAVLSMRRCLVSKRTDVKNNIRGILKSYGIRLGTVGPTKLREKVEACYGTFSHEVEFAVEGMLEVFDLLTRRLEKIDAKLGEIAKKDPEISLLMTIPGIGQVTALTYKNEIHTPERFKDSKNVGAYLGMTPTQYASGETIKQGRISKRGSNELRFLLTEAALVLLTRSKKWSKLKACGLKLMRKKGMQKACLAVGRKLSVIMHRMLIEKKEFTYGEPIKKAA